MEIYAENYETIQVAREGRVGIIYWNRPETLNAFNQTMYAEWVEAYDAFNHDDTIGAVVCTGTGRAYSSGADIGGFEKTFTGDTGPSNEKKPPHPAFDPWYMTEGKPTIAAVNGVSIGIGFTSILWYDLILASTKARFSARFPAIGLTPEASSTWILPRLIGFQHAKEMMLTGRILDAETARELGIVREVVEPDDLLPRAIELATEIAANPSETLQNIKLMLMEDLLATDLSMIERRSNHNFARARKSAEHREGLLALRESRSPKYHEIQYMNQLRESLQ
tara:strand:+ start:18157 stop:18996 length:840 start_codon:yes stop_codon:yes gene_type:complete